MGSFQAMAALEQWGLLLLQDARLPSLAGLVAGGPVRGSWWGHAKGNEIFRAGEALETSPDVFTAKRVSGKVTFVHRRFWPHLAAIGSSRETWQVAGLAGEAAALLARVEKEPNVRASGPAAKTLEARLLVASRQVHTEGGAHATELMAWQAFAREKGLPRPGISAAQSRAALETLITAMNGEFDGRGRLPWQGKKAPRPTGP